MRLIDTKLIYDSIMKQALNCVCVIDHAVSQHLNNALQKESSKAARFALETIVKSNSIAADIMIPACQDTGMALIFLDVGSEVVFTGEFIDDAVNRAVRNSYILYRKSVLDPLTRENTKDNTPAIIHTRFVKGDKVRVSFLAKGFGSENMSRLYMLTPSDGIEGIKRAAVETVISAGGNPCPPVILGIGIGGTMEKAALMAKEALLREAGTPSENETVAALEREILDLLNASKVGAMGFGGDTTALGVHILTYPTHIAALPVAINVQCHSVRHMSEVI